MWRGCRSFLLPYRYGCLHELALTRSRFCTRKRFTSFIRCEEQHRVLDAILHFFHSLFNPDGLRELIRAGGAPLYLLVLLPLFEPSALPSPGPQRCPTPVIWHSTFLAGFFGSAP